MLITVTQLVKKFPVFYITRMFITVFTRARHWSLSWARRIYSTEQNHKKPQTKIRTGHLRNKSPEHQCYISLLDNTHTHTYIHTYIHCRKSRKEVPWIDTRCTSLSSWCAYPKISWIFIQSHFMNHRLPKQQHQIAHYTAESIKMRGQFGILPCV
jgi:hypothetical protein